MRVPLPGSFLSLPLCHRGYHNHTGGIFENSLPAFQAAIDAGYGIELDIQLSRDGQAIVFHDDTLDRVTGARGLVIDYTADELGQIAILGNSGTIPTLAQTLDLVAGRAPLLIELKDQSQFMSGTDGALETATARALAGYAGLVALMSFNPDTIAQFISLAPHLPRGLVTSSWGAEDLALYGAARCDELRPIPDYDRCLASFISHEMADLPRPRVSQLKSQGAAILTWTVRSAAEESSARAVADNITFESYAARIPA